MRPLLARTRRVESDVDLLAAAGRDGILFERARAGLAGRGQALRVPAATAADVLAGIKSDDEVRLAGTGPVAFGALPFRAGAQAELVVPEVVWGRAEGGGACWVTTVSEDPGLDPLAVDEAQRRWRGGQGALGAYPSEVVVAATSPAQRWCELVERASQVLRSAPMGGLAKIVLAREVVVRADAPFDRSAILDALRRAYPGCFLFHVEGFLGASPELLVGRDGEVVRAQPMAGTAPRNGDPAGDARLAAALAASATYRREHQLTIDMVHETLLPWCSYLDYEAAPSVVGVGSVQHLATLVEGRLSQPAPPVLELVEALHPTPAVAGWPREEAIRWIEANEGIDRGRYAGTVGWVDSAGNGAWAVSIRCAEVEGNRARLWAGNGIVAGSDPVAELAETQAKLQAMLSAIVRV